MDVYAIITKNGLANERIEIPNSQQYESITHVEKKLSTKNVFLLSKTRVSSDTLYEDSDIIIASTGNLSIDAITRTLDDVAERYRKEGDGLFERLQGSFNLIIIDKQNLQVKIISDHFGLVPLFYCCGTKTLVVSTKLDFVRKNAMDVSHELDCTAILEHVCLNYILGEKTFFKNILMQNAASILEFSFTESGIRKKETVYWHLSELMGSIQLSYDEALEHYAHLFHRNVNASLRENTRPVQALTAGYDTRTIFAALQSNCNSIPCFSYGMRGSLDITIPLMMQEKLGFQFSPLYLEDDFQEHFVDFAVQAIFHSDGLGDLEKANNEYAYRHLSSKYTDVIVGIFGSEFIKFPSFPNRLMPNTVLACFPFYLNTAIGLNADYFNPDCLSDCMKSIRQYVTTEYVNKYEGLSDTHKLFLFYYYEAVRKYFMKELRIGRYHVNIAIPFIDKDLLEILFRSRLSNAYNYVPSGSNLYHKQRTHFLYSYIMKKYMPAVLDITTNRGYRPRYDLSPLSRFFILPHYIKQKMKKPKPQYAYDVWAKPFLRKYMSVLEQSDQLKPLLKDDRTSLDIHDGGRLHRLLSVAVYVHGLSR